MQETASSSSLSSVPESAASITTLPVSKAPEFTSTNRPSKPYVLIPTLPLSAKQEYKPIEPTSLKMEMEIDIDEVVGEYKEGRMLYYFARYQGGIAHKYPAQSFTRNHPDLVKKYEKAKADGQYSEFNPSAHYVHPMSRVRMKGGDKARASVSSARSIHSDSSVQYVPDSEEEQLGASGEDASYNGDSPIGSKPRLRQSTLKQTTLPFSPRRTRAQRITVVESESETDTSRPVRNTRRATVKVNIDSDYEEDEEDEDDESEYSSLRPSGKGKRAAQPRVPIPSYGHIHDVNTLKYDPYPDDEEHIALREHRNICEKCHMKPAHLLLRSLDRRAKGKGKKRKRSSEDELEVSDGERFSNMGGWVRCLKCPVSVHWQCLASTQQAEILKAARNKDRLDWIAQGRGEDSPSRRSFLETNETTEFICAACTRGGPCIGCMETVNNPLSAVMPGKDANGDLQMSEENPLVEDAPAMELKLDRQLLFRCFTCKRLAHYDHLPLPRSLQPDATISDVAAYYQGKGWLCADCVSFRYPVDKILAWRPYPSNAVESGGVANYRDHLFREYLVKWAERSYRRLSWVPHMWLLSTHQGKLKNFLTGGAKVNLLPAVPDNDQETSESGERNRFEIGAESRASSSHPGTMANHGPLDALPDAEKWIPPTWKTVDRVLDIIFWDAESSSDKASKRKRAPVVESDEEESMGQDMPDEVLAVFETGELSETLPQMNASEWENAVGDITEQDVDKILWAFIKWDDLGYEEATWDAPPRRGEPGYGAFVNAFKRFIHSRAVFVPILKPAEQKKFDNRPADGYRKYILKDPAGLQLGQDPTLKLMPFQVDGFNWLCDNWWNHQPCILADDMGLGKTVQMASFLGTIATKWKAYPALVVVPNSTIVNWIREFERWAPNLRVVPFYGERKARDIIKQFELFHNKAPEGHTSAKFHVLVTTYEGITANKDWGAVFKRQNRWEALVVDEGQRLKSDSSLLFRKLNELNSAHRVIMTGTPLNNNMRELFNLMNFLDPQEWKDLEALEKQYTELDEELIKQLHSRLRPYFLRRIKSEVLQLPPKNEVIVPVSMAPLQRQVYRSILSHNLDLLKGLTQRNKTNSGTKGKLNNILMHLRKCLQHPYLYSEDIEPRGLPPHEVHGKLIDASAKLRFLKLLLPKLKARGHRVLLFSQFVLALDVIEDFLNGEGFKYLRLDGNTKGAVRQKSMDEFNKPSSEYFIFLLTTRAGGVGINLYTADTVIIFDPDFNPHQDLQAIARAYRYGQKNTCLVFKLMVKDSAEERIMQIGKKKLVLDHLIVQKMDEDEDSPGENVQSILTYGAQALFEDQNQSVKDIVYSDQDIEKLIDKTEMEGDASEGPKEGGLTFSFAKVWATDKNDLEDVGDEDQVDSWAQTLEKINQEKEKEITKEQALSGRGARRRAAAVAQAKLTVQDSFGPDLTVKRKGSSDRDLDFQDQDSIASDTESNVSAGTEDMDFEMAGQKVRKKSKQGLQIVALEDIEVSREEILDCGLCGGKHGIKQCLMTDKSGNLADYRLMLIMHADDEPWEERYAAVMAIDELLHSRGHAHLVQGQPLYPIPKSTHIPPTKKPKQAAEAAKEYVQKQHAGTVPKPTIADYQGRPETEVVRSFRTQQKSQDTSNAIAGPSRVQQSVSAAGESTAAAPVERAVAGPSKSATPGNIVGDKVRRFESNATITNVGTSQGQTRCPICNSRPAHRVEECPGVLNQPLQRIRQMIGDIERTGEPQVNSKAAELIASLRNYHMSKQKK